MAKTPQAYEKQQRMIAYRRIELRERIHRRTHERAIAGYYFVLGVMVAGTIAALIAISRGALP